MKKIIDGKLYNTETAELIGEHSNGRYYTDFEWMRESLYKTKNGHYFLHGEGGARTKYASHSGNCCGDGEAIIPINEEKAKEWMEEYESADKYVAAFGEIPEA